ncbi:MAG: FYDLN acid domain-containing protein [Bradymonadia bacterium]
MKPELGSKHTCGECGAKYYDFNKADPVCPKCGAPAPAPEPVKIKSSKKSSRKAPPKVVKDPEAEEEFEGDDIDLGDDIGDDDINDDDIDLG